MITRDEVLRRLCRMSASVAAAFNYSHAADCFCGDNPIASRWLEQGRWRYDEEPLAFIEAAVAERLERDKKPAAAP